MTDRSDVVTFGGSVVVLVDVVANSAEMLMSVSSILLPALAYLAGDLGDMIGVDQEIMTYLFAVFGVLFVINQLYEATKKIENHVNE